MNLVIIMLFTATDNTIHLWEKTKRIVYLWMKKEITFIDPVYHQSISMYMRYKLTLKTWLFFMIWIFNYHKLALSPNWIHHLIKRLDMKISFWRNCNSRNVIVCVWPMLSPYILGCSQSWNSRFVLLLPSSVLLSINPKSIICHPKLSEKV